MTRSVPAAAALAALLLMAMSASAASFDEVLAGAKKEGKLVVWVSTPNKETTHSALAEAFNKRFGLQTKWEWVAMHPQQSVTRVITEAAAGRVNVDLVGAGSADHITKLRERDLVKAYPWVETFKSALPTIAEPVDRVLPEIRGSALSWFDNVYGVAWNTKLVKAEEVPTRLDQFADPKWKGRFVLNALGGAPLDVLSLSVGEDKTLDLVRKLVANQPNLQRGTPSVSNAITTGEGHIGLSSFFNADRAQRGGEPQQFRFFEDTIPVVPLHVYVPEKSPNPNTARLFAAWLVTEGARIAEEREAPSRISDPDSKLAKAVKAEAGKAVIVEAKSMADVEKASGVAEKISAIFTGKSR